MGLIKNVGCGRRRIDFFVTGSESDVRHWTVWFRQLCRLALLWGLGVARGGVGGLPTCRSLTGQEGG